jgi:O-antigen ligase
VARKITALTPRTHTGLAPGPVQPDNIAAKFGFTILSAYTFLLFSRAVEFIDTTGSLHLMVLIGMPAILLAAMSGKVVPALRTKIGRYLILLSIWMVLGLPFSVWRGGSVTAFTSGWAKSIVIFMLVGALLDNLDQLRSFVFVIAWATAAMIFVVNRHAIQSSDARMATGWGTLGNANDLATVLIIGLPFCMHVVTDKRRLIVTRVWFLLVAAAGLLTSLKTGSRGALVAIILLMAFAFVKASPTNRLAIAVVFVGFVGSLPFLLTPELKARYMTILESGNADEAAATARDANVKSALQSTEARRDLLKHALQLSMQHPVFGVGYAEFPVADSNRAAAEGQEAYWHEVHNIFAVILVENGVPALILFCAAFWWAVRIAARNYNAARKDPAQKELARFSLCLLTAPAAYFVCNNFGTDAYGFQFPLLGGIAAALEMITRHQAQTPAIAMPPAVAPYRRGIVRPRIRNMNPVNAAIPEL